MKTLTTLTLAPLLALATACGGSTEEQASLPRSDLPERYYLPGLGFLLGLALIYAVGVLG